MKYEKSNYFSYKFKLMCGSKNASSCNIASHSKNNSIHRFALIKNVLNFEMDICDLLKYFLIMIEKYMSVLTVILLL